MADNLEDLLAKINGRKVEVGGKQVVLRTAGAPVKEIPEGLRTRVLKYIADPNIAFILMMMGLAGLYFEFAHPGVVLPGVIGGICLLLAFFAFQTLPINFIGILLILLAFIFFILEFKITSYGLLSVAGLVSLLLGGMMLFRGGEGGVDISWGVLIPTVVHYFPVFHPGGRDCLSQPPAAVHDRCGRHGGGAGRGLYPLEPGRAGLCPRRVLAGRERRRPLPKGKPW